MCEIICEFEEKPYNITGRNLRQNIVKPFSKQESKMVWFHVKKENFQKCCMSKKTFRSRKVMIVLNFCLWKKKLFGPHGRTQEQNL